MVAPFSDGSFDSSSQISEVGRHVSEIVKRYLDQLQEGTAPDPETVVAEHPELAPVLGWRLAFVEMVYRSAQNLPDVEGTAADSPASLVLEGEPANSQKGDPPDAADGSTAPQPDEAAPRVSPQRIGRFVLLQVLGRGSFSTVYKAHDPELHRTVAVKVPRGNYFETPEEEKRFFHEARAAAGLQHPRIVRIHEIARDNDVPYLVCEYIEGQTLADWLRGAVIQFRDAANLIANVADALEYAHQHGVIHRDVKTSNILIDMTGESYVSDFGLAHHDDAEMTVTLDGDILGTPSFMPPEQAVGDLAAVGAPSDVYSLGVVLYRILCGEMPFRGSQQMLLHQVMNEQPKPPRNINEKIPRDLETITLKAMSKEPRKRYQSAREMADDLRRWLNGEPIRATAVGRLEKGLRWCRKNPVVVALSLAVVVLLLASTIVNGFRASRERGLRAKALKAIEDQQNEHQRADENARDSRRQLVRLFVANGVSRLEDADFMPSMVWFASAMEMDTDLLERNAVHRVRMGTILSQCPKLTQLWLHEGPVRHAEFSPDGRLIVSASGDGTVVVWDSENGDKVCGPFYHENGATFATFSPDGTRVISTGKDDVARIWDSETGDAVTPPMGHEGDVVHAAFSPDGCLVATACLDGTASIWDAKTGDRLLQLGENALKKKTDNKLLGRPVGPNVAPAGTTKIRVSPVPPGVKYVQFSPNGLTLLTAGGYYRTGHLCEAQMWDAQTGQRQGALMRHDDFVWYASFSPNGDRIVTASKDGTARVWDGETGEPLTPPLVHEGAVRTAEFSPDGERVLTCSSDGTARMWHSETGEPTQTPARHGIVVTQTHFSPDGCLFATAGADGGARIWSSKTMTPVGPPLPQLDVIEHVVFAPDGHRVLAASDDGTVRIWDLAISSPAPLFEHSKWQTRARFSPDGQIVITTSRDGTARIWDVATREATSADMVHEAPVLDGAFSPGGHIVGTAAADGTARLWDIQGKPLTEPLPHPEAVRRLVFSPNGNKFVTACNDGVARLWDTETARLLASLEHRDAVFDVVFSPDGRFIATASADGTARIWRSDSGTPTIEPLQHDGAVRCVRFSPDVRLLATASRDKTAGIWDVESGRPVRSPLICRRWLESLSFSRDGNSLAIGGHDGFAGLWDLSNERPICQQLPHGDANVNTVQYSRDGHFLLTMSRGILQPRIIPFADNGAAQVWSATTGAPVTPRLRHRGRLTSAEFRRDGRAIIAASENGSSRIWSLAKDERPVQDLKRLVELLACRRIDPVIGLVPVPTSELKATLQSLKDEYPDSFACSEAEVAEWRQWMAAGFDK